MELKTEWRKTDTTLQQVHITETILNEIPIANWNKMIADREKEITEADVKKYTDSLKASVDAMKEISLTAKSV